MTDELREWVVATFSALKAGEVLEIDRLADAHPLSASVAQFWIRRFCDEVEKRLKASVDLVELDRPHGEGLNYEAMMVEEIFYEVKNELLGD